MRACLAAIVCGLAGCGLVIDLTPPAPADAGAAVQPDAHTDAFVAPIDAGLDDVADASAWTSVLDFHAATEACPTGWTASGGVVGCEADSSCAPRIAATFVNVPLPSYTEVRGRARGLQWFSTDAFDSTATIDEPYVDGVSITTGSPRTHVFTFASGLLLDGTGRNMCPCLLGGEPPPPFVGDDWVCDSGNATTAWDNVYYELPLWDADADTAACTPLGDPGWFHVVLDPPATGPLEIRILGDQCDENVVVTDLELFVR